MKLLSVIQKDLSQSFRSVTAIIFMLGVPILVVVMFYFMFGGSTRDGGTFQIAQTSVQIVNLDEGDPMFTTGMTQDEAHDLNEMGIKIADISSMGDLLVQMLSSEQFSELVSISEAREIEGARSAVDNQITNVAIIIPDDFTQALIAADETAVVEFYQDPTLTLGPSIIKSIISQFLDYTVATKIGVNVVSAQLKDANLYTPGIEQQIALQFLTPTQESTPIDSLLDIHSIDESRFSSPFSAMLGMYMGGMLIFYAFYTGVASTQSILREEEQATLPRLFTTPTPLWTILSGKFTATAFTVLIQVITLLVFSNLVFQVYWGKLLQVALVTFGIVLTSTSFGIFTMSLIKNAKQSGAIFGGVLTTTGMLGISSIFVMGLPQTPKLVETLSLLVPQGWAMTSLRMALEEASMGEFLPIIGGLLLWSVFFLTIGLLRFRKRYI